MPGSNNTLPAGARRSALEQRGRQTPADQRQAGHGAVGGEGLAMGAGQQEQTSEQIVVPRCLGARFGTLLQGRFFRRHRFLRGTSPVHMRTDAPSRAREYDNFDTHLHGSHTVNFSVTNICKRPG